MVIMMNDEDLNRKIKIIIDKINPYIMSDGGKLEFVKYENKTVYVKLSGACAECGMLDITLKDGIEQLIKNEIPEVENVVNIG